VLLPLPFCMHSSFYIYGHPYPAQSHLLRLLCPSRSASDPASTRVPRAVLAFHSRLSALVPHFLLRMFAYPSLSLSFSFCHSPCVLPPDCLRATAMQATPTAHRGLISARCADERSSLSSTPQRKTEANLPGQVWWPRA
jgi:hypothetical protein